MRSCPVEFAVGVDPVRCGKPVSSEDTGVDEFGLAVHQECRDEMLKEKPPEPKPKAS